MDVQMPVMDGLEATRRITALHTGVPVIGLTAHALEEERQRCRDAGMVAHVAKPVEIDELVAVLRRCARPF
jgi:CheY-like chemotaxis protein